MHTDEVYFLHTPPMEFLRDVNEIIKGGDNLTPVSILGDVSRLIERYINIHPTSLEWQFLELGWQVENFPPSVEETELITALGVLREKAKKLQEAKNAS
jgi:hypothetical protein